MKFPVKILPLIIVPAAVGLVFFLSHRGQAVKNSSTVFITEQGFEPNRVTVPVGSEIVWRNTGQNLHWPASDFHPTHTVYPEDGGCLGSKFDACRGLETGETYSFVFDKAGKWPVHDHLYPGLTMVVEAVDEAGQQSDILQKIKGFFIKQETSAVKFPSAEDFKAVSYEEQIKLIRELSLDDSSKAWILLKAGYLVNGQVVGNPHELAHIIGNNGYKKLGLDAVKICDATFAFGCFHGVTEQLLQEKGAAVIPEVEKKCLEFFPPQQTQNYTGCIHGMGHGLLALENLDLHRALADCDALSQQFRYYCYDGVFMENAFISKIEVDETDPWNFCADFPEQYHLNCARYQAQRFRQYFGWQPAQISKYCLMTNAEIFRKVCSESIGYQIAQNSQGDAAKIKEQCAAITDQKAKSHCVSGAAREVIFQGYADWEETSASLCSILPASEKAACLESNKSEIAIKNKQI